MATQGIVQYNTTGSVDAAQFDYVRLAKNIGTTGFGTLIPQWGNATDDIIAAIGTAVMWSEASTMIACTDVVATNVVNSSKTTNSTAPKATTTAKTTQLSYEKINANKRLANMERRLAIY